MNDRTRNSRAGVSAVAWIALIVGVIALILAWMAYNRTGADLEQQIQDTVNQSLNTAEDATQNASDAIDAGPDGVDEDDTDVQTTP